MIVAGGLPGGAAAVKAATADVALVFFIGEDLIAKSDLRRDAEPARRKSDWGVIDAEHRNRPETSGNDSAQVVPSASAFAVLTEVRPGIRTRNALAMSMREKRRVTSAWNYGLLTSRRTLISKRRLRKLGRSIAPARLTVTMHAFFISRIEQLAERSMASCDAGAIFTVPANLSVAGLRHQLRLAQLPRCLSPGRRLLWGAS